MRSKAVKIGVGLSNPRLHLCRHINLRFEFALRHSRLSACCPTLSLQSGMSLLGSWAVASGRSEGYAVLQQASLHEAL